MSQPQYWTLPHPIKISEALGAIADGRVEIDHTRGSMTRVLSSSRQKSYIVTYDPLTRAIMSDDNGSYYVGYLGYPSIAFLMQIGELPLRSDFAEALREIHWKDLNQSLNNNFDTAEKYVEILMQNRGVEIETYHEYITEILNSIDRAPYQLLGEKTIPLLGY